MLNDVMQRKFFVRSDGEFFKLSILCKANVSAAEFTNYFQSNFCLKKNCIIIHEHKIIIFRKRLKN